MLPHSHKAIELAIATDRAYVPWCATTILSCALQRGRRELRIHVIHGDDLGNDDLTLLLRMADSQKVAIQLHPFPESDASFLPSKGPALGGRLSWARILLPQILPEIDRVIYLDADTLVVDEIQSLWNTDLDQAPVAAVSNVTNPAMQPHLASLGIVSPGDYFNAGVLLADLRMWREESATAEMIDLVKSREPLSWFDQDALNLHFAHRWERLHPRWNAMNSLWVWSAWARNVFGDDALGTAKSRPAILHFEGPSLAKPWHFLCFHPWREKYRAVLNSTPWGGVPLEDRTLGTRAIARLPRAARIPAYVRLNQLRSFAVATSEARRDGKLRRRRR